MTDAIIAFIDRGNAAASGAGITVGVTLTADKTDTNEYYVVFSKDAASTSARHVKSGHIIPDHKVTGASQYTATAATYISALDDTDGQILTITAQLYQKTATTDVTIGALVTQSITFKNLQISNLASFIAAEISTTKPAPKNTYYTAGQYNKLTIDLTTKKSSFAAPDQLGVDITFTPLPDSSVSIWNDLGAAPSTAATPAVQIGSVFIVKLTKVTPKASLYITSTDNFATQADVGSPVYPYMMFIDKDQHFVEYIAPKPVGLIGNTVTIPATQSSIFFNIDPDAIGTGDDRIFWMTLNGTKSVFDPTYITQISSSISVPVVKLNTNNNAPGQQDNRLQYFVESLSTGAIGSSEYGLTFHINSQFQNNPDPTNTTRPYMTPTLYPTPNGGVHNLISIAYVDTNTGALGQFFTAAAATSAPTDITMNVYINGWDNEGNPKGTTLHPTVTFDGTNFSFKINSDDLLGYSVNPGNHGEFTTMKIEYYISNPSNINYNKYSKISTYYLDTVSP